MSDVPALSFQRVGQVIGDARVLDEVSFTLAQGETLAIVGDSGSGKTTLARIAGALAMAGEGSVRIFGIDPADRRATPALRARIGMVLQGGSLFDELTIEDNLRLGIGAGSAAAWRGHAARVDRLLYEFGLEDLVDQPVAQLPTGARRQLEILRALLREPALLVLDEPFEGAAARVHERITAVRRSLRRRGGAMLLVTQDAALAALAADRQLTLHRGCLVQQSAEVSRSAATSALTASTVAATLS